MTSLSQLLAKYDKTEQERQEKLATACKEATAVFRKHFPGDNGNLDAPIVLAACVELFDLDNHKDAGQLYLEWLVEHYVGRKVAANLDDVKMIVEALKTNSYTQDSPYVFNDCDNQLFYIPHEKLIFCIESQNTRYIYILHNNKLHIRRYYDEYDFDGEKDEWAHREEEAYKKKGIHEAIANAGWLTEQWSDCVSDNDYPERPSLQYFKDCDFNPQYGDCRDIGYVLSYEDLMSPRADRALFNYIDVKMAFFYLRQAVGEVETEFEGH